MRIRFSLISGLSQIAVVLKLGTQVHALGPKMVTQTPRIEKVINGTPASISDFPYAAFIYINLRNSGEACAGALISPNYVLTAAHCLFNSDNSQFNPSDVYIGLGSQYNIEQNNQIYQASQLIPNEKFNPVQVTDDIGLIKLSRSVPASVAVPGKIYNQEIVDNMPASAAGWGITSNDANATISSILLEVPLVISSSSQCQTLNPNWNGNNKRTVCTLNQNNQDTCYGDSGGPLSYTGDNSRPVIGVTSIGNAPGNPERPDCGLPGGGAFYTHAFYYIDWISKNTGISKSNLVFDPNSKYSSAINVQPGFLYICALSAFSAYILLSNNMFL
ncbi:Chymotrypsin-2 [Zancudomyces culisetae]|uniref:Chymotrypsin-2 n=1 Tax=Zancudomyces culisetae TaxID=1213189 RepID=A0A1R1PZC0_ZANCU|nr:Chymotrypsin-2 [Zancudomyces culisetae]|eukprot:OMH86277.1 Chymotrypsin-2 [Zancudomyces culisetae]